jgi:hemoglobin
MTDASGESAYQALGGEAGVRELVERFYEYMDSLPQAREIRAMHGKNLKASREKLFLFLSGWLGGPDLYVARYGHPRLRQRHLPFAIDSAARDQWLACMARALDDMRLSSSLRQSLWDAFCKTADHMRNRSDYAGEPQLPLHPGV